MAVVSGWHAALDRRVAWPACLELGDVDAKHMQCKFKSQLNRLGSSDDTCPRWFPTVRTSLAVLVKQTLSLTERFVLGSMIDAGSARGLPATAQATAV
jgi:hypothetical protein